MTPQETAAVLALMSGAWPNQTITDETTAVWADQLASVDPDSALAAARRLIQTEEWFPPVTKFLAAAQAVARRRALDTPAIPESTGLPVAGERAKQLVEQARRVLRHEDDLCGATEETL